MSSLYFKLGPKGYTKTHRPAPPYIDFSRQIPVYRVVNQFMNLEPQEQLQRTDHQEQPSTFYVNISPSSTSDPDQPQYQLQSVAPLHNQTRHRDEVQSTYTEEPSLNSMQGAKQKQLSMKDMKASQVGTVIKADPRADQAMTLEAQKTTEGKPRSNQRLLEFELEKERILRNNLEKQYEHLLQTLREREVKLYFQEEEDFGMGERKTQQRRAQTERQQKMVHQFEESGCNDRNRLKMRKSCTDLQKEVSRKRDYDDYEALNHDRYLNQFYEQEKWFQHKLRTDMLKLRERVQKIDRRILRDELCHQKCQTKIGNLALENTQLKQQLSAQNINKLQANLCPPASAKPMREHMQYIFTIFIMFLCFALFAKNRK